MCPQPKGSHATHLYHFPTCVGIISSWFMSLVGKMHKKYNFRALTILILIWMFNPLFYMFSFNGPNNYCNNLVANCSLAIIYGRCGVFSMRLISQIRYSEDFYSEMVSVGFRIFIAIVWASCWWAAVVSHRSFSKSGSISPEFSTNRILDNTQEPEPVELCEYLSILSRNDSTQDPVDRQLLKKSPLHHEVPFHFNAYLGCYPCLFPNI